MLVLTRNTQETLIINKEITVTILSVKGGQVRLGICAPKDVVVDRLEVHELKKSQLPDWVNKPSNVKPINDDRGNC
jgi:carbon storage regulator